MEQDILASKFISQTEIGKGEPKDGKKPMSKKTSSPSKKPFSGTASSTSKKPKRKKRKKKLHAYQTKPAYTPEYVKRLSKMLVMKSFYVPKPRKRLDENLLEKITLTLGKRQYEIEKDQQMREMIKGFRYSQYKKPEKKIKLKHRVYINKLLQQLPIGQNLWSKASSETEEKDSLDEWMDEWLKGYEFGGSIRREPDERFTFDFKDYELDFDFEEFKLLKAEGALRRSRRYVSKRTKTTKSITKFGDYKRSTRLLRPKVRDTKRLRLDEVLHEPKPVPESQYMKFLRKKLEQQEQRQRQIAKRTQSKISKISESKIEKTIVFDKKYKLKPFVEGESVRKSQKISVGVRESKMSTIEIPESKRVTSKSIYKLPSKREMQEKLQEYGITAKISWPSPSEFVKQILGLRIKDKLISSIEERTKKDLLSERLHGGNPSLMLESIKINVGQATRYVFSEYKKQLKVILNRKEEKEIWKKINLIKNSIINYVLNDLKPYVDGEGADCTAQDMANKFDTILDDSVTKIVYGGNYRVYENILDTFVVHSKILSGLDKYRTLAEIEAFIAGILPLGAARIKPRQLSILKNHIYNNLQKAFHDFVVDSRKPEAVQALIDNIMENSLNEFLKQQGKILDENEKQEVLMKMRLLRSSVSKLIEELKLFIESEGENCTTEKIQEQMQKILLRVMSELFSEEKQYVTFIDDLLLAREKREQQMNQKKILESVPVVIDSVVKDMLKKRLERFDMDSGKVLMKQFQLIAKQIPSIALKEVNEFVLAQGGHCTLEDIIAKIETWISKKLDGVFGEFHETVHEKVVEEVMDTSKIDISEETKQKISKEKEILEKTKQLFLKEQDISETEEKVIKKTKDQAQKELRFSFKNRVRNNVQKEVRGYLRKGGAQADNIKTMVRNIQGMVDRAMNEVLSHYMKDMDVPLVVMGEKLFLNKMDILRGNLTTNIMKKVKDFIQVRGDFVTAEEIMSTFDKALNDALAVVFDEQEEAVFDNILDELLYHSKKLELTEEEKETIQKKAKEQTKKELRTALKSRIGKNLKMELKKHVRKSIFQVQKAEKVVGDIHRMINRAMVDGVGTCMTDLNIPIVRVDDEHLLHKVDATRRHLSNAIIKKVKDLIETRIMYSEPEESKNQLENVVDGALSTIFDEEGNIDLDQLLDELVLQKTEKEISEEKEELIPISVEAKDIDDIKEGRHSALLSNPVFLQKIYNKIDELLEAETLAFKEYKSKYIEKSTPVKYKDLRIETTMDDILAQRGFHRCVKPLKNVLKQERGAGEGSFITVRPMRKIITLRKKRQPVEPIIEETVKEAIKSFLALPKKQSRGSRKVSVPVVSLEIFSEDKTDDMLLEDSIFDSEEMRIFIKSLTIGKSYAQAKKSIADMLSGTVPFPQRMLETVVDGCTRGSSGVKMCYSA